MRYFDTDDVIIWCVPDDAYADERPPSDWVELSLGEFEDKIASEPTMPIAWPEEHYSSEKGGSERIEAALKLLMVRIRSDMEKCRNIGFTIGAEVDSSNVYTGKQTYVITISAPELIQ